MLALVAGLVCGYYLLCYIFREPVMNKVYKRLDIFYRKTTHALFSLFYHFRDVREFLIIEPADPLKKIITVLCKMVRNRWQDGVEHVT